VDLVNTTSGQLFFSIHAFHGLIDGESIALIERDLRNAYHGLSIADDTRGFVDSMNIASKKYSGTSSPSESYIMGTGSSSLELSQTSTSTSQTSLSSGTLSTPLSLVHQHATMKYTNVAPIPTCVLLSIGSRYSCTLAIVLQGLWALTLAATQVETVSFAAVGSGRHQSDIDFIDTIVGPVLKLSLRSDDMSTRTPLQSLFNHLQAQHILSYDEVHTSSPHDVHREALAPSGLRTVFNFQCYLSVQPPVETPSGLRLTTTKLYDPWNFDVHFSLQERDGIVNAQLQHWMPAVAEQTAQELARRFRNLVDVLVERRMSDNDMRVEEVLKRTEF
jgi:hypothetical protein